VYVTFLRHKWTRAEDAGTWENKHHRSTGAKIYSWVHAIATAEENEILLTGSKTDDRGMTSPNVAKVETNVQKLVIGILYQVHMTYLQQEDHGQDRAGSVSETRVLVTHGQVGSATNLPVD
jgi:hypothetical protein